MKILIVDDNPTNLKFARDVLMSEEFEVATASDADQTLQILQENPLPSVILMDIALPGTDGLKLTRLLKANPRTASILIIALTAFAMKGDEEKAIAAGCDGYLTKPIGARKIVEQVGEYLRKQPANAERAA